MKNIHIVPTDKPSRLVQRRIAKELKFSLMDNPQLWNNINIYITSDEEIKECDWYLTFLNKEVIGKPRKCEDSNWNFSGCKKIILTTDQDLIKDGVQAIDDEFLEWFVKNPSCDYVDVKYDKDVFPYGVETAKSYGWYKTIIPKEEPKQETLEEVAESYWVKQPYNEDAFIEGAKWQAERMYSEEDMIDFVKWLIKRLPPQYDCDTTTNYIPQVMINEEEQLWTKGHSSRTEFYTTKELLQLWKEQRTKKVYYEN